MFSQYVVNHNMIQQLADMDHGVDDKEILYSWPDPCSGWCSPHYSATPQGTVASAFVKILRKQKVHSGSLRTWITGPSYINVGDPFQPFFHETRTSFFPFLRLLFVEPLVLPIPLFHEFSLTNRACLFDRIFCYFLWEAMTIFDHFGAGRPSWLSSIPSSIFSVFAGSSPFSSSPEDSDKSPLTNEISAALDTKFNGLWVCANTGFSTLYQWSSLSGSSPEPFFARMVLDNHSCFNHLNFCRSFSTDLSNFVTPLELFGISDLKVFFLHSWNKFFLYILENFIVWRILFESNFFVIFCSLFFLRPRYWMFFSSNKDCKSHNIYSNETKTFEIVKHTTRNSWISDNVFLFIFRNLFNPTNVRAGEGGGGASNSPHPHVITVEPKYYRVTFYRFLFSQFRPWSRDVIILAWHNF